MRYFIIFYTGNSINGRSFGTTTQAEDGFVNRFKIVQSLESQTGWRGLCITNIIEVSSEDYSSFKR